MGCALTGLFPGEMPMDEVINKSEGKREDKYSGERHWIFEKENTKFSELKKKAIFSAILNINRKFVGVGSDTTNWPTKLNDCL